MIDFVVQPNPAPRFTSPPTRVPARSGSPVPPVPPATPAATDPAAPAHDDIARRAYDIYVRKGRPQGQCQENWKQAERELRKQAATAGPPGLPGRAARSTP